MSRHWSNCGKGKLGTPTSVVFVLQSCCVPERESNTSFLQQLIPLPCSWLHQTSAAQAAFVSHYWEDFLFKTLFLTQQNKGV